MIEPVCNFLTALLDKLASGVPDTVRTACASCVDDKQHAWMKP